MQFNIRAIAASGVQSFLLEALDAEDARRQLAQRQWQVLSIAPARRAFVSPRRAVFNRVLFCQELLALLQAGLGLAEGIEALLDQHAAPASRQVLERLLALLRDGFKFSDALAQQPQIFPPLFIGIIQAAERTSDLPRALDRYIDYEVRLDAVRSRIISASIYPAILLVVGVSVTLFLLGYVVPRFAAVYDGSGRPMPLLSYLLLQAGSAIGQYPIWVLGSLIALSLLGLSACRSVIRRRGFAALLHLMPGAAQRVRIMELSRLYLTLGMLLEGGIPILRALDMASASVSSARGTAVKQAAKLVSGGAPLSQALQQHDLSTVIVQRMLHVGERSGQMGVMLTRSALYYEGQTARWIERFTKTFEPVLMAAIGLAIGLIVVLLYMPIFDLAGSLQ